jgi:hypothetical protein
MAELDLKNDVPAFIDGGAQFRTPVSDEYLAGETIFLWSTREHFRRQMNIQRAEVRKADATLGELLFRMKRKLARMGRNGGWSAWLRQNGISRASADRLVLGFAESRGLTDELSHREFIEPLQGNVCIAAHRTCDRLEAMLNTPRSRMIFIQVLADLLDLEVDLEGGVHSVRLSIPKPIDENDPSIYAVPSSISVQDDGIIRPVDYELKDESREDLPS